MPAAFVYDAVRTPFGRLNGAVAEVRPDDLAATTARALVDRSPRWGPLGSSGARILGTLAESLRRNRVRWGVAAICIGVGRSLAMVLANVATA